MDKKSVSYKVISFVLSNLVSFFKIKNTKIFYARAFVVLAVLGLIVDIVCVLLMAFWFHKVIESVIAFFVLGLIRVGKGDHKDGWFDCFILTINIFSLYIVFMVKFSTSWECNILVIVMIALLFIKWGEYYPVLKKRVKKTKEFIICRLKL